MDQDNVTVQNCLKDVRWVLTNRRIFFMSPAEDYAEVEISAKERANETTIQFLHQIGAMLRCDNDTVSVEPFSAHYSYDQRHLSDVYVKVEKRCTNSEACMDDSLNKEELIGKMFEHYLSNIPRTHYGYNSPNNKPNWTVDTEPHCLDENGYSTYPLEEQSSGIGTCFSLWMVDRNRNSSATGLQIDYYAGQPGFNRVDQDEFVFQNGVSIPQFFYANNRFPCYVLPIKGDDSQENNLPNSCEAFLSADHYAMLCCCYQNMGLCHMPNSASIHYRSEDNLKPQISCAYGTFTYEFQQSNSEEHKHPVWVNFDNESLDTLKKNITTDTNACKLTYSFTENRSETTAPFNAGHHHHSLKEFVMNMGAVEKSECVNFKNSHSMFFCELKQVICPLVKPTGQVLSKFDVICCCGEPYDPANDKNTPKDLCNLDFLLYNIQDSIPEVFRSPLCSYSTHYYRLFGRFLYEKYTYASNERIICTVYYDINLNRTVYLLDGNNFDFAFDPEFSSQRINNAISNLVIGKPKPLVINQNCSENPYNISTSFQYRGIYVHKCDPIGSGKDASSATDPECDTKIEKNIVELWELNKARVMRKCLEFNTSQAVSTKEELIRQMHSSQRYVYADATFACFAFINSTILTEYNEKHKPKRRTMFHTIEAGPLPSDKTGENAHVRVCNGIMGAIEASNSIIGSYCVADADEKGAAHTQSNFGTRNGTLLCCCFVGLGWEGCNIRKKILNYVDMYDLRRDNDTIAEVYKEDQYCEADSFTAQMTNGYDIKKEIDNRTLKQCVQPHGCFRIHDIAHPQQLRRFEIWAGCISRIPDFVLITARSRLSYMCTTNAFKLTNETKTKCMSVDLGPYFKQDTDHKPHVESGSDHETIAVICCCEKNCTKEAVEKHYKFLPVAPAPTDASGK
ncbi:hypothetical protein Ddc_14981 [Ditylenchus destructor]|nr:hypothetical protein Ddc_14981 [Ditylenchus destructor]